VVWSVRAWVRVKVESVLPCSCIVLVVVDRGHGRDNRHGGDGLKERHDHQDGDDRESDDPYC